MNKFEQVSSVGYQMSLAGDQGWEGGMSDTGGWGGGYTVRFYVLWVMVTWGPTPHVNRQT